MNIDKGAGRVVATFISIVVVLIILAIYGCASDGDQAVSEPLPPSRYDVEMNRLDREALDKAYIAHMALLFEIWMKDPGSGPARAMIGAGHTRKAYIDVRDAIEKRVIQTPLPRPKPE